jgi:predicted helicase
MYSRFFRWAMDRLNDNGIIAFITNRSFIDSRTFDGFRKTIQTDFDHAYIIDTKSDVRANPKIAGTTHNVFGIQAGVAILLLVKSTTGKIKEHNCKIEYVAMEDEWRKEEKLQWLAEHPIEKIEFENITPDKNNNWINLTDNDWDSLLPICSKDVKNGKGQGAIFELLSNGIVSARDEWSYDFNKSSLSEKAEFFCEFYTKEQLRGRNSDKKIKTNDFVDRTIKFGSEIEVHMAKGDKLEFDKNNIVVSLFRPFINKFFYFDRIYTHRIYQLDNIFGRIEKFENKVIAFLSIASSHDLYCLVSPKIFDAGLLKQGNGLTSSVSRYRYGKSGEQIDNITDWGLEQFNQHYHNGMALHTYPEDAELIQSLPITKEEVFHYVYAVLHHPAYRKKYELNLKREFPRIPLYDDFYQWAKWGEQLMKLHIDYEKAKPYELYRQDLLVEPAAGAKLDSMYKAKLKANKATGSIELDGFTILCGIPSIAWDYKLGNRSALEWILDQYKEKKPTDPTIAEKFNTYKFADYKEQVIDLLKRVCTVSVQTMEIVNAMPAV